MSVCRTVNPSELQAGAAYDASASGDPADWTLADALAGKVSTVSPKW